MWTILLQEKKFLFHVNLLSLVFNTFLLTADKVSERFTWDDKKCKQNFKKEYVELWKLSLLNQWRLFWAYTKKVKRITEK